MTCRRSVSSRAFLLLGLASAPSGAMAQTQTPSTAHGGMTNSDDKMGGVMDKDKTKPSMQMAAGSTGVVGRSGVMLSDHTMRTSKLIGAAVFNDQGENVGTVEDIIVTAGAVEPSVVVSVGGFLGMGEKLTTEPLSHLKLGMGDKMMMPGLTKPMLTARPSFKYDYSPEGGGG